MMMRTILASAFCLSLAGWSSAQACSTSAAIDAAFNYQTLDQGCLATRWDWAEKGESDPSLNTLLSQLDVLIIAQPIEDNIVNAPIATYPATLFFPEDDTREYRRVEWDIIKTLKGEPNAPLYLRDKNGKIKPILSQDTDTISSEKTHHRNQSQARENFIEEIKSRVADRNSFPFWDAPIIANVLMVDVSKMTSCGEVYTPAYDFSRFYLVGLDKRGTTVFAEPLKDETDSFVTGIERVIQGGSFSPKISTGEFFAEMDTRDIIEINSCSLELQNRNATSQLWQPYGDDIEEIYDSENGFPEDIKFKRIGPSTLHSVDLEKLSKSTPALLEYFNKDKSKVTCKAGEQFAVYANANTYASFPIIPEYRFARVRDELINIEDILTNYTLKGPNHLPVQDFLNPKKQTDAPE